MPPAILSRISQSLRQQQKKISCHSDSKRQLDGSETCPICWKNLPKKPQCLPCGHLFCKGCIVDLREHAKSISASAKCPICRGPLEQEDFKKLYKRACHHEQIGSTLIGLGAATSYGSNIPHNTDFTFLSNEVIREYGLAASKLEECLVLMDGLDPEEEEPKQKQYRVATLLKLQQVLKYHVLPETQYEKRIFLLKEAILLSPKPIPDAHLELGKIFVQLERQEHEQDEGSGYYELAMDQFDIILRLAEQRRLSLGSSKKKNNGGASSSTIKKARKLRGKAHFQMALSHQALGEYPTAAKHYDLAHKYKSCVFYRKASKCFFIAGNNQKAIFYGKLALLEEQEDPQCETHLLLLSIYEKLFLVEQLEGHLSDSKHYRYHSDIEQYCACLIQAKNLCTQSQERAEVFLRMDTFSGLIPWKLAAIQDHFPKKAFNSSYDISHHSSPTHNRHARSNGGTGNTYIGESYTPSENTYEMGEMEDSLYSNSLYSNSFDYANDDDDEDGEQYHSRRSDNDDVHSDLLTDNDDETGDNWTAVEEEDGLSFQSKEDNGSNEPSLLLLDNLKMQDVEDDSDLETEEIVKSKDDCSKEEDVITLESTEDDVEHASCHDDDNNNATETTFLENQSMQDAEDDADLEMDDKSETKEEEDVVVTLESMEGNASSHVDNDDTEENQSLEEDDAALEMDDKSETKEDKDVVVTLESMEGDASSHANNDHDNTMGTSSLENLKTRDEEDDAAQETNEIVEITGESQEPGSVDDDSNNDDVKESAPDNLTMHDGEDDSEADQIVEINVDSEQSEMEPIHQSTKESLSLVESSHDDTPDEADGTDENEDPLVDAKSNDNEDPKHLSESEEEDHPITLDASDELEANDEVEADI